MVTQTGVATADAAGAYLGCLIGQLLKPYRPVQASMALN